MIARWLVLLPAVCGAGDAWMRFTLEHTASTSDGIGLLSILPTSNRSYLVQDVRSRGYDRDLHLDGVTLGHSEELRAMIGEIFRCVGELLIAKRDLIAAVGSFVEQKVRKLVGEDQTVFHRWSS